MLLNKNKTKFNLASVPDAFLVFHVDLWEEGVASLLERTHFFPKNLLIKNNETNIRYKQTNNKIGTNKK